MVHESAQHSTTGSEHLELDNVVVRRVEQGRTINRNINHPVPDMEQGLAGLDVGAGHDSNESDSKYDISSFDSDTNDSYSYRSAIEDVPAATNNRNNASSVVLSSDEMYAVSSDSSEGEESDSSREPNTNTTTGGRNAVEDSTVDDSAVDVNSSALSLSSLPVSGEATSSEPRIGTRSDNNTSASKLPTSDSNASNSIQLSSANINSSSSSVVLDTSESS